MPGDDLKLNLRLTADSKGFVGEVRVAGRELDKLTGSTGRASRAAQEHARQLRRGQVATKGFAQSLAAAHGRIIGYVGGIAGITAATRGLLRHADSYTQISNAVCIATDSAGEHARVSAEIFDITQRTRAPLTTVADRQPTTA